MKDFLHSTLASILGTICALVILFFIASTWFVEELPPDIPDSCVLVIDDSLVVSERGSFGDIQALVGRGTGPSVPLRKVVQAIDSAAEDGRIDAILLLDHGSYSGIAAVGEVQQALIRFRAAGKRVFAFAADYDMRSYYLASVADPIYLPPLGLLDLKGLAAELMFYAEAMERVGVEMQVTRVGKYKSAVEPFLLARASEANLEQVRRLLDTVQANWTADVSAARGIEAGAFAGLLAEGGLYTATDALQAGLVDKIAYHDEMIDDLMEMVGSDGANPDSFAQVGLQRYLEDMGEDGDGLDFEHRIAVVYAVGTIYDGYDDKDIGGDTLARQLREVRLDADIDALVLRVDSPGGSATASEVILREMQLLKQAGKPVIVSMGSVAASGGYWISCQADGIVAAPSTITGSIGVFGMSPNIEGLMEDVGVHVDTVQTGPFSSLMSIYRHKTDAELALMQQYVDAIYDGFLDRVSSGRDLEREVVHDIAQGRVWAGSDALTLGLVDQLGDLDDAIALAAEALDADEWFVDYREPEANAVEQVLAQMLAPEDYPVAAVDTLLPQALQPLWERLGHAARMLQHPGIYARLPYALSIR
jgi:protease-4